MSANQPFQVPSFVYATFASALALAGCSGASEAVSNSSAPILGGFPATSTRFDAVGDIAEVLNIAADGTPTMDAKCTGVLIGPHSVLTASHCAEKFGPRDSFTYTEAYFRVGAASATPQEQVRIVSAVKSPDITGGPLQLGTDIAIFQLASDITDVTPMPIGASPTAAELGTTFYAIGYGLQATTDPAGTFYVRSFGSMLLTALQGNPLQVEWPTFGAFVAAIQRIDANITAAELMPFYNDAKLDVQVGEDAYFSGASDYGVQPCSGDSGGPILRRTATGFEIAGIFSGFPTRIDGTCFGGAYYGLPNTSDNATFIAAQLADPTLGVPNAGYCNATSAIRSVTVPTEGTTPIDILECSTLGMVCGVVDGSATCVDPGTSGPATNCSFGGSTFSVASAGGTFLQSFGTDGTFARGTVSGTYTFANGILTLNENNDVCSGSPGAYAITFSSDCSSFTNTLVSDGCELRAEATDGATWTREAPVDAGSPDAGSGSAAVDASRD